MKFEWLLCGCLFLFVYFVKTLYRFEEPKENIQTQLLISSRNGLCPQKVPAFRFVYRSGIFRIPDVSKIELLCFGCKEFTLGDCVTWFV